MGFKRVRLLCMRAVDEDGWIVFQGYAKILHLADILSHSSGYLETISARGHL